MEYVCAVCEALLRSKYMSELIQYKNFAVVSTFSLGFSFLVSSSRSFSCCLNWFQTMSTFMRVSLDGLLEGAMLSFSRTGE